MKHCPYCKVDIGGDPGKCPLCQSKLTGQGEAPYFPHLNEVYKKQSLFYKIQLLCVWVVLIVGLGLDFALKLRLPGYPDLHWSLLLAMWLMVIEFGIMRRFKPGTGSAGKVTAIVLITLACLLVTAAYLDFFDLTLQLIVPIVLTAMIVADFVLAMVDKHNNNMTYLLTGLAIGVLPSLGYFLAHWTLTLTWTICLLVSVVLFVGAVIFKGKAVAAELRRRFNI
ncbi:MAG: hypothetical protein IK125_09375 [Lachnospiraceae bacterium]|nr:hypothetical protein [Lachnospiraceae bacterium]